ncbi:MAG: 3-isopropylmalate dehydratase large subunit [Rhodocyclaceae bacterium]
MSRSTLFEEIWSRHAVEELPGGETLLYIDRHLANELTSPVAFRRLAARGRSVRRPDRTWAFVDHMVATAPGRDSESFAPALPYLRALRDSAREAGIRLFDLDDPGQGIVHLAAAEAGLVLPGMTVVCGDSHTCTLGALGAIAFGIGTGEMEHVLATQTLRLRRPPVMRIACEGVLVPPVSAKDLALHVIGRLGAAGAAGHAVEFAGSAIRALDMDGRFTLCNLAVEFGGRFAVIRPDETTTAWLRGLPEPRGAALPEAVRPVPACSEGVRFDVECSFRADGLEPQITWGTSPAQVVAIGGAVPDPAALEGRAAEAAARAIDYMGLEAGRPLAGLAVDDVFIGSCTNGRLSDLRAAAAIARGRRVAAGVRAWVVPGSQAVRRCAEAEGLHEVFLAAGFEWREPGCSRCVAVNGETVGAGRRAVSTSNRNFENRQGRGARTHLASPATAAACAIAGRICDPREF